MVLDKRRTFLKTAFAAGICMSFPRSAFAHRQKQAQSTIKWNNGSKILEVSHRMHMHDAETALAVLGKLDRPDLTSLKARALLALYVEENFGVKNLNGSNLDLTILGAETEGSHVYVYQEVKLDAKPDGLLIWNRIMHDVYPDQINHVNVALSATIQSAVFAFGDKAKKVLA